MPVPARALVFALLTISTSGVAAPAGTAQVVVTRLSAEVNAIVAQPDVAERFYNQGIEPVGSTPEQFAAFIRNSVAKYAKIVKALGVKPE